MSAMAVQTLYREPVPQSDALHLARAEVLQLIVEQEQQPTAAEWGEWTELNAPSDSRGRGIKRQITPDSKKAIAKVVARNSKVEKTNRAIDAASAPTAELKCQVCLRPESL
mmetsp:Transcript_41600/g.109736  ORF Transcript_41600/g.109736 Transcript_41600/m.109736 type:complete len:111 (-) Transcript_41600:567-899(-)